MDTGAGGTTSRASTLALLKDQVDAIRTQLQVKGAEVERKMQGMRATHSPEPPCSDQVIGAAKPVAVLPQHSSAVAAVPVGAAEGERLGEKDRDGALQRQVENQERQLALFREQFEQQNQALQQLLALQQQQQQQQQQPPPPAVTPPAATTPVAAAAAAQRSLLVASANTVHSVPSPLPAPAAAAAPFTPGAVLCRPLDEVLLQCPTFRSNFDACDAARRLEIRSGWAPGTPWLHPLVLECFHQDNFSPIGFPAPGAPSAPSVSPARGGSASAHAPVDTSVWEPPLPEPTLVAAAPPPASPAAGASAIERNIAEEIIRQAGLGAPPAPVPPAPIPGVAEYLTDASLLTAARHTPTPGGAGAFPAAGSAVELDLLRGQVERLSAEKVELAGVVDGLQGVLGEMQAKMEEQDRVVHDLMARLDAEKRGAAEGVEQGHRRNEELTQMLEERGQRLVEMEAALRRKEGELREKDRHLTLQSVEIAKLRGGAGRAPSTSGVPIDRQPSPFRGAGVGAPDADAPKSYGSRLQELLLKRKAASPEDSRSAAYTPVLHDLSLRSVTETFP